MMWIMRKRFLEEEGEDRTLSNIASGYLAEGEDRIFKQHSAWISGERRDGFQNGGRISGIYK